MTRNESDWIRDWFDARTRILTLASAFSAGHVLYAPYAPDFAVSKRCAGVLSDAELRRSEGFATDRLTSHFNQRRAFRRYCGALACSLSRPLSRIIFAEKAKGRPYLPARPDLWFSFSSCRFGFLGAWSATHGIGIDVEDQTRDVDAAELARRFFTEAEAKAVEKAEGLARRQAFFQLWSLKEAALKSIGEGLPFGLDTFEFELAPHLRVVHTPREYGTPERFNVHVIERTNSCAAVVTRKRGFDVAARRGSLEQIKR